ncbi:MAG TPA: alcohol dehydrogenase catalytic domain-containing protein, partial [Anaerolineaceae bacterium]
MRTIYVDKDIPRIVVTQALKPIWPGVIFSRLSPTRFVEIPDPPLPAPGWVRIKNIQCGICASDLALLSASADPRIAPAALPGMQRFYLGHELVGEVSEVGAGVDSLKVGDRVIMDSEGPTCASMGIDPPCPQCARGNFMLCENGSSGSGGHSIGGGWGDCYVTHQSAVYKIPGWLSDDQAALV